MWSFVQDIASQTQAALEWMLRLPDPLYDLIDRNNGSPGVVTEHLEYWTATVAALIMLATVGSMFVLRFVAVQRHRTWDLVNRRYERGKAAAEAQLPNSHIPRSSPELDRSTEGTRTDKRARGGAVAYREATSKQLLLTWARLQYVEERLAETLGDVLRAFGGRFLWSPRLGTALTPAVIVVATTMVFTNRPIDGQGEWIEGALHDAWTWVTSPVPRRLVPLAVLIIAVLLVIRATPVIDQIRARDEAAKDVNRLLGELQGRLERLSMAVWEWREELEDCRPRMVIKWVEALTKGGYSWSYDGGIYAVERDDHRYDRRFSDTPFDEERLLKALGDVAELETRIQETGFEHVAVNSTWPIYDSLQELDLLQGHTARAVAIRIRSRRRDRIPVPADIAESFERFSHQARFWVHELDRQQSRESRGRMTESEVTNASVAPQSQLTEDQLTMVRRLEAQLEDAAFECARMADGYLAELLVKEMHLHRIQRFLRRRARGSAVTRPLAVIQK